MSSACVIEVSNLRKAYGSTVAVDDVSFGVREGEIFGLIGPNGAGKTTTMECVEGIRKPDSGSISVLGMDPRRNAYKLQTLIGIQLQEAQLQKRIKVWEAVDLWSSLYPKNIDTVGLIEQLGLTDKRNARFMTLSGGQKQRPLHRLGIDSRPRRRLLGRTNHGPRSPGAPRNLEPGYGHSRPRQDSIFDNPFDGRSGAGCAIEWSSSSTEKSSRWGAHLSWSESTAHKGAWCFHATARESPRWSNASRRVEAVRRDGLTYSVSGSGPDFVSEMIRFISEESIRVTDFRTVVPTLEDVFLKLTGHGIRD